MVVLNIPKYSELIFESIPFHFWEGMPEIKGLSVFLKPNLVSPKTSWDRHSCTHIKVVEIIIQKLIAEKAKQIIIGECGFKDQWENTLKSTGYYKLIEKYPQIKIIPLQDGENYHKFTLVRLEKYRSLFGAKFSNYMLDCDVVINIPKMKVHCMAGMTGAIKNMMGTMTSKGNMHPRGSCNILQERLADLYQLTSNLVQFTIMDGIIGQEYSEQCGNPVKSGILMSGTNQWEIDVAACKLMGIKPDKITYLRYIQETLKTSFNTVNPPLELIKKYELPKF
jgi:uncharacterized protein (DUF362 family)